MKERELVHEVPMLTVKPSVSSADSADVGANAEAQESEITFVGGMGLC